MDENPYEAPQVGMNYELQITRRKRQRQGRSGDQSCLRHSEGL